jgi:hypothetical protein
VISKLAPGGELVTFNDLAWLAGTSTKIAIAAIKHTHVRRGIENSTNQKNSNFENRNTTGGFIEDGIRMRNCQSAEVRMRSNPRARLYPGTKR